MKQCKVCEATSLTTKMYGDYCRKHYLQMSRHGKILSRTIYDPNEFIIEGDICKIELYNTKCEVIGYAIIDAEDIPKVRDTKWYSKGGYVRGSVKGQTKKVFLHRLIMDCPDGLFVDHIKGNPLDNRKAMLRVCTHSQNLKNMSHRKDRGIKLVQSGRYQVVITVDYQCIYLGTFDTLEMARKVRKDAEIKYYGEFS